MKGKPSENQSSVVDLVKDVAAAIGPRVAAVEIHMHLGEMKHVTRVEFRPESRPQIQPRGR